MTSLSEVPLVNPEGQTKQQNSEEKKKKGGTERELPFRLSEH